MAAKTKVTPTFTSIRIRTDTHVELLKIGARLLLNDGKPRTMDELVDLLVVEHKRKP
jgi:hypothetical protein